MGPPCHTIIIDYVLLVQDWKADVIREPPETMYRLNHCLFDTGDRAILSRRGKKELPRSATVITATECTVYHLKRKHVEELKEYDPSIVQAVVLKASRDKCNTELRKYLPYACWTDHQLNKRIRKRLVTVTETALYVPVPRPGNCALLLSGSFVLFEEPVKQEVTSACCHEDCSKIAQSFCRLAIVVVHINRHLGVHIKYIK